MPEPYETPVLLSGRYFTAQEIEEIKETVRMLLRLSRYELAKTLCENLDWFTPSGHYKVDSCKQLFNKLEERRMDWMDSGGPQPSLELHCKQYSFANISLGPRKEPGQ